MKIKEVITNESIQLDEGVLDTVKQKLQGILNNIRASFPNFDNVMKQMKAHEQQLDAIAINLQKQSETKKISKDELIAAVKPIAFQVAKEIKSSSGQVNENYHNERDMKDYNKKVQSDAVTAVGSAALGGLYMLFTVVMALRERSFLLGVVMIVGGFIACLLIGNHQASAQQELETNTLNAANKKVEQKLGADKTRDTVKSAVWGSRVSNAYQYYIIHDKPEYSRSYEERRQLEHLYDKGFRSGDYYKIRSELIDKICRTLQVTYDDFKNSEYLKLLDRTIEN
jgi:hypothetical protein